MVGFSDTQVELIRLSLQGFGLGFIRAWGFGGLLTDSMRLLNTVLHPKNPINPKSYKP